MTEEARLGGAPNSDDAPMEVSLNRVMWKTLGDAERVLGLLRPGESILRAAPAQATMPRAGLVALAYAAPALALSGFPLHKALAQAAAAGAQPSDRLALAAFAAFGLIWMAIGVRLLWEPIRLLRLYPHVMHVLTTERFVEIDRRRGLVHDLPLAQIWRMKTFSPFGRLTLWRRGYATETGARARTRAFDGIGDVEALAQEIADRTGVPVGQGRAAATASLKTMPAQRRSGA